MRFIKFCCIFTIFSSLSACVTSHDLAEGQDDYVDPTNVTTVDPAGSPQAHAPGATPMSMDSLQRELDVVKGRLEEAEYKTKNLEAENKRLSEELVKAKTPAQPPAALVNPSPIPVAGDLPNKTGAPLLWELAQQDLKKGRFKEALSPLDELVKTYPKDSRAYYALLAISMIHYRVENFKEAALAFNQVIDRYPKRPETAIAWFGQGAAFYRLGQKDDSKLFYGETVKRYPKGEASIQAKKFLAKKSGGAPKDLFAVFSDWDEKAPR